MTLYDALQYCNLAKAGLEETGQARVQKIVCYKAGFQRPASENYGQQDDSSYDAAQHQPSSFGAQAADIYYSQSAECSHQFPLTSQPPAPSIYRVLIGLIVHTHLTSTSGC